MKVTVEAPLCIGSGSCEMLAPDIFAVGDDGIAAVLVDEVDATQEASARQAAAGCPTQAIIVAD